MIASHYFIMNFCINYFVSNSIRYNKIVYPPACIFFSSMKHI